MNLIHDRYTRFALVREMMETVGVIRSFDASASLPVVDPIQRWGRLFLTGEGSSRIFPAKNARRKALRWGIDLRLETEGARQAAEYALDRFVVFFATNSGRTKEVVHLARRLAASGHPHRYALTANAHTPIEEACVRVFLLRCGQEQAVAATKSVVEQALFYESILWDLADRKPGDGCQSLAQAIEEALTLPIDPAIVQAAAQAPTIFFAGYNDGVAEELTLKTNEITRKKSDFLEGTYAVHGIEEVMGPDDIVFEVDPIPEEVEKFEEVLVKGVGLRVVAIADRETPFPTIRVPSVGEWSPYVFLCAGWNLLVEIGLALQINLDKPERARKVGNEIVG